MQILCPWESPQYLVVSSNIPTLLYYSHFLSVLAAAIFGLLLIFKARGSIVIKAFLWTIICFTVWTVLDVLLWASNRADIVLFLWSVQVIFEMLTYAGAFYLSYVFIFNKDLSFRGKLITFLLLLPIVFLMPSNILLPGVDIATCNAIESNFIVIYTYAVEALLTLAVLVAAFKGTYKADQKRKKEVTLFTFGIIIFLLAFASGNIVGSLTDDWSIAQVGLLGMPIFIAFLTYTTIEFKTFNIKLLGTQGLVGALWLLTLAILFVRSIDNVRFIVIATLILFTILGYQLIRGVRREIEAREKIEKLAGELRVANAGQENLIHVINHQLKGYLAKGRNVFAELNENPSLGLSAMAKPMVKEGFDSLTEGVAFVQQILNSSSAEKGTLQYNMQKIDLKPIFLDVAAKQKEKADAKSLSYTVTAPDGEFLVQADGIQIKEAMRNLIDNSIVYTPSGQVSVELRRAAGKVIMSVKDSGIGLDKEDMGHLFTKGGRGQESLKYNVNSTGYGLAFVMGVVKAHNGRVWAESAGRGKGSQFYMELPEAK